MDQVHTEVKNGEAYLHALLNTVVDGAVTICPNGIIQAFNHAAETIFHYSAEEVIGQNVNLLMPKPYHSEHDGYLNNYANTSEAIVIGIWREVKARRKDERNKQELDDFAYIAVHT